MDIRNLDNTIKPDKFNLYAQHPLQSWEWGEARLSMGIDLVRLGEYTNSKLVNVFTVSFHKIPGTPLSIGYVPRSVIPSNDVLQAIKELGNQKNAVFIKWEPALKITPPPEESHNVESLLLETEPTEPEPIITDPNFDNYKISTTRSTHPLFPEWTQVMDLTPSVEDMLAHMKSKTRYNVKLAEKKGVIVEENTSEEGFKIFSDLYFQTTQRQKYHGHSPDYHKKVFNVLKDSISHILIASYNGIPLAAYHLFMFKNVLYYPYGGSSPEYRNLMAPHLLMWKSIVFGKEHGCESFDMWGSLPPTYQSEIGWSGFTRFKEGFGTNFVQFAHGRDQVLTSGGYKLYNVAHSIRSKFLL